MEDGLPVLKTAEKVQADIAKEYAIKLCVNGGNMIPDPLKLDWLNEEEGIKYQPVSLGHIQFLSFSCYRTCKQQPL